MFKAAVFLTLACSHSVMAAPTLPEGLVGVTQETMIGRSLAPNAQVQMVGDDREHGPHVLPFPNSGPVIRRWVGDDDYPIKRPRSIVVPRYPDSAALPAICADEYFTMELGWANYLGARCLEENFQDARFLPQACAMTIRTEGRLRDVYDEYCLRQAGYTVSGW